MSGKARPSLRAKTLYNVSHYSGLSQTDKDCIAEVFRKCGEYEDTGLTPEKIKRAKMETDAGCVKAVARTYGIDINRLRELAEADKDGCVIVTDAPPAADVVPVVHGKWEKTSKCYGAIAGHCSICGLASGLWYVNMPYKYCPYCGARMDGDRK